MNENVIFAFTLTFLAGISTGIGGLLAFFVKKDNAKFLSLGLGFSAGVMIYISLVEINKKASESLISYLGENTGEWITLAAFIFGVLITAIVDKLLPSTINQDYLSIKNPSSQKLNRVGIFVAIAVAIHNFPEGLATFMSGLSDSALGISIAVAIAIHNIPEGIAIALPIYNATKSKKKAFAFSAISGLAEPAGAFIGYFLLKPYFNDLTFGLLFAAVAGIMIYISFDELLPSAKDYGDGHIEIFGAIAGMLVMWISLIIL